MNEIRAFVEAHATRHPELRRRVQWQDVRAMAAREGVSLHLVPMSRPGRLISFGDHWEIQMSDELDAGARAFVGVHELVHYWRDRETGPTFYSTEAWEPEPCEDFANLVAWYCTSTAREFFDPD